MVILNPAPPVAVSVTRRWHHVPHWTCALLHLRTRLLLQSGSIGGMEARERLSVLWVRRRVRTMHGPPSLESPALEGRDPQAGFGNMTRTVTTDGDYLERLQRSSPVSILS